MDKLVRRNDMTGVENQFIHQLLRHRLGQRQSISKLGILARYCSRTTLERIARELAALHQSACIDFASELGIDQSVCVQAMPQASPESPSLNSGDAQPVRPTATTTEPPPAASCGGIR